MLCIAWLLDLDLESDDLAHTASMTVNKYMFVESGLSKGEASPHTCDIRCRPARASILEILSVKKVLETRNAP